VRAGSEFELASRAGGGSTAGARFGFLECGLVLGDVAAPERCVTAAGADTAGDATGARSTGPFDAGAQKSVGGGDGRAA
jgi:hypothetical protein